MKFTPLPLPNTDMKFPLMKALQLRRTKRKWTDEQLSLQTISDILWVAGGTTQFAKGKAKSKRTAPSACNSGEISVYIALESGLCLYDSMHHRLINVLDEDIREYIGTQKMMQNAPLALIYVSDYSKMKNMVFKDESRKQYTSAADTGFMSQNVYLYCAATNLNTAVLGLVDRKSLHGKMKLGENEKVVYTQVVGKAPEEINIPSINSQAEFDKIIENLLHKEQSKTTKSFYILKHLPQEADRYYKNISKLYIKLIQTADSQNLKRFLAKAISKIDFTEIEREILWKIFSRWLVDKKESKSVRASALDSLHILSLNCSARNKALRNISVSIKQENIKSLNTKLRKFGYKI